MRAESFRADQPERRSLSHSFEDLGVSEALSADLARVGITEAFPIQEKTLPDSLSGRDVLGRGRTGSGKTIAFVAPIVEHLLRTRPEGGRTVGSGKVTKITETEVTLREIVQDAAGEWIERTSLLQLQETGR